MTRFTTRASKSWTPVCPGPGPELCCYRPIHSLNCTGIYPCKPPDCFPSPGASTVSTESPGHSTASTSSTWISCPNCNVNTSLPKPQPPECSLSSATTATLPDGPSRDARHTISAGTTGPHPHRQGTRCVPSNHPASFPASNPSPMWSSGCCSSDGASECCCSINTDFFYPGGRWSDSECCWCNEFPRATCHFSEYRS